MHDSELCYTSAVDLVELVKAKKISPVEIMDAVVARAEHLQPRYNPFATPTFETARAQAKEAEAALMRGEATGRLHGMPMTLKDLVFTKGVRTMGGSHVFADRVPDFDAPIVERLRGQGAISIGKTTVPEMGWIGTGDSPLTGSSHNPWKHGYNAGGSSTGAAICAAAGIGPLHQGSDGAGSIRMPAAFCGIYGIKPSFGRVPYYPIPNNDLISHIGPMTRTVADSALMLEVMAGPDDRDQTSLEAPPAPYLAELDRGIKGLRVAYSPDLGYLKVDPEIATSVANAAKAFEEMGCHVETLKPMWSDPIEMEHCFYASNYVGNIGPILDNWADKMDQGLVAMTRWGTKFTAGDWVRARQQRSDLYDKVRRLFEKYDLLVTPTLSVAAFPVGRIIPEHWEQHPWDWHRWAGFSYPFNLTWVPAATCPCGFTSDGLPIGLQIVGPRNNDLRVLQASRAFELARPWAEKRPPV